MATTILISNGFAGSADAMKKIRVHCDKGEPTFSDVLGFSERAIEELVANTGQGVGTPIGEIEDTFEINFNDILAELRDLRQRCR